MTSPSTDADRLERFEVLERGTTTAEALEFFDACPAVAPREMLGDWRGGGLRTGHPMDGMLEATGWHGKRFDSTEAVHPLVFGRGGTRFSVNPALVPMGAAQKLTPLVEKPPVSAAVTRLLRLARTKRPAARLRTMEYRGVPTATMSYDALPINDHFRRVDADTVIGAMDLRGSEQPFFFTLRREGR